MQSTYCTARDNGHDVVTHGNGRSTGGKACFAINSFGAFNLIPRATAVRCAQQLETPPHRVAVDIAYTVVYKNHPVQKGALCSICKDSAPLLSTSIRVVDIGRRPCAYGHKLFIAERPYTTKLTFP